MTNRALNSKCAVSSSTCTISPNTFQSIYLLTVIGGYKDGVYGLKRLQKVAYLSELDSPLKPYTFKRHHYGQYSEELADINNQLIELKYVNPSLFYGSQCCIYSLSPDVDLSYYKDILARIDPKLVERIRETIDEFGYLPEEELIEWCYSLPEFKTKDSGDIVLEAAIPGDIKVPGLNAEQCENLELTFSAAFINSMSVIVDGLNSTTIDIEKVKKVAIKI